MPGELGENLGRRVINMACSGAVMNEISEEAQAEGSEYYGSKAQLEHLRDELALGTQVELVVMTIGGNDLLIAAHALSRKLTLVTNNDREFSRVEAVPETDSIPTAGGSRA